MRFRIRFSEIFFEKFTNFELSSQIYIKIKEFDYLLKNQQFIIDYIQKNSIDLMRKLIDMLFVIIFFCGTYIDNIS